MPADSFKGYDRVDIQPGDTNIPIRFKFNPASASTKNDGALPYGSTLAAITVTSHYGRTSTATTTSLVGSVSLSSNASIVMLKYSTDLAAGVHHLSLNVSASIEGSTLVMQREYDFNRVYVKDR